MNSGDDQTLLSIVRRPPKVSPGKPRLKATDVHIVTQRPTLSTEMRHTTKYFDNNSIILLIVC